MNLATARSVKRAKEVGVRKSVGARRGLLIRQFLGESLLMTAFALIVAVLLTGAFLPQFNQLTNKQMVMPLTSLGSGLHYLV
jgi:ABC-type antimicrobial peptide transport system permease subunit